MPKFEITSPEGQRYEITAPEGATEDQVLNYAKSQFSKPSTPTPPEKGYLEKRVDAIKQFADPEFWKRAGHELANFPPMTPETQNQMQKDAVDMAMSFGPTTPGPKLALENNALKFLPYNTPMPPGPITRAAKAVGRSVRDTLDLILPGGAERIANRYTDKIIGDQGRQAVIKALSDAQEIVPGSVPTAAEAVAHIPEGSPLIAHQKIVAETPGGISAQFGQRALDQEVARQAALAPIARTPAELAAAEAARTSAAAKNYPAAFQQAIKADPELIALSKNPYFKDALPDAVKLAEAKGINPKENLTEFLHYVKISLDKTLSKTGDTALSNTEKEVVQGVKNNLLEWIKTKNPLYDAARSEFEAASKPINQMQVGQALQKKLVNPSGTETPGAFLRAADDAQNLIRSSTGMPRQQLGQVLDAGQQKVVQAVAEDLERKLASQKPIQRTALQGGVNVAEESAAHLPNLLSRPAMVLNYIRRSLGAGIEPKVDQILAQRYLNPQQMAEAMQQATPAERKVIEAIMNSMRDKNLVGRYVLGTEADNAVQR